MAEGAEGAEGDKGDERNAGICLAYSSFGKPLFEKWFVQMGIAQIPPLLSNGHHEALFLDPNSSFLIDNMT